MWGAVRPLLGVDSYKKRLGAVGFDRSAINAPTATYQKSGAHGRYLHSVVSRYREVLENGISPKYMADGDFRLRAKQPSALEFCPSGAVAGGVGGSRTFRAGITGRRAEVRRLFRGDVHRAARCWEEESAIRARDVPTPYPL